VFRSHEVMGLKWWPILNPSMDEIAATWYMRPYCYIRSRDGKW
jgi:hypothetical protein